VELRCLETYKYGEMPRLTQKQAKDMDLDAKVYNGREVALFEAGQVYDVDNPLARRLLRDHGPKKGRAPVRFEPVNPSEMLALLMGEADKVSLADVLDRGFVVGEDAEATRQKEVTVA
jgi:hypothetical protein